MSDVLQQAQQELLAPGDLDAQRVETVLGSLLGHQIDAGELYFQTSRQESWVLEDQLVKDGSFSVDRGVGVRAIAGEKTGFAYADEIAPAALQQAAGAARSIARAGADRSVQAWQKSSAPARYQRIDPIPSMQDPDKVALLRRVDAYTRALDPAVAEVTVSMAANHETMLVMSSDGTFSADERPLVRMNVSVIVARDGRRERGSSGGGGRYDYNYFVEKDGSGTGDEERVFAYAREAVRIALVNLQAQDAPAGAMPVVLGPGWPGVLLHEAVGHGLEGDFNRKGTSTYAGRIGELVASPLCTVVDDGTMIDRRGSLTVDDEGTPSAENVLIENGVLTGYLQDKHNAGLMGVKPTGNGRRQSYAHLPMPRMTNTFMRAGPHDPEEIIASVKRGLYAVNFGGGQVDITSGKFVFSTTEAYLIEDGKVTAPVKGATLIGNGPEAMTRVSMVGNDLALDSGVGVCGKDGQSVPVGVGQPSLKVDELIVGGVS